MTEANDPLWNHFKPLWLDFAKAGDGVLVAGGYGLFLKQQWLLGSGKQPIVVPFENWPNAAPRATGDMDLVVALDLISDETANKQLFDALDRQNFEVSRTPHGKRWQFFKEIGDDQHVLVELHAPLPDVDIDSLTANRFAVKHKPSLGDKGVHGRTNLEAIGNELHPFRFVLDGVNIVVPNPVTWSVMKLTAAEDTWKSSRSPKKTPEDRAFFRNQSIKHAHDVCRVVAMMTKDESDASTEVADELKSTHQFERASQIFSEFFTGADMWANEVLADKWLPEDLEIIHRLLRSWYA